MQVTVNGSTTYLFLCITSWVQPGCSMILPISSFTKPILRKHSTSYRELRLREVTKMFVDWTMTMCTILSAFTSSKRVTAFTTGGVLVAIPSMHRVVQSRLRRRELQAYKSFCCMLRVKFASFGVRCRVTALCVPLNRNPLLVWASLRFCLPKRKGKPFHGYILFKLFMAVHSNLAEM